MIAISDALSTARITAVLQLLQLGDGNAHIDIYDGTRPTGGGAATNKLVSLALDKPPGAVTAAASPAKAVLTLSSADLPLIAITGVATWARITNQNGDYVFDCDVAVVGASTGEIKLTSTQLYAGGKTQLASGVLA
jgi:malonyl CoA-acyl carrier protein transacylase